MSAIVTLMHEISRKTLYDTHQAHGSSKISGGPIYVKIWNYPGWPHWCIKFQGKGYTTPKRHTKLQKHTNEEDFNSNWRKLVFSTSPLKIWRTELSQWELSLTVPSLFVALLVVLQHHQRAALPTFLKVHLLQLGMLGEEATLCPAQTAEYLR